jgi:hypothetical protein
MFGRKPLERLLAQHGSEEAAPGAAPSASPSY